MEGGRLEAGRLPPYQTAPKLSSRPRPKRSRRVCGAAGQALAGSDWEQCPWAVPTQAGLPRGPVSYGEARLVFAGTLGEHAGKSRHEPAKLISVKAFCAECHACFTLLQSSRGDDRVMVATAVDKRGSYDRGVLEQLVGTDRDVVIEVGAIARKFKDENPGLWLVGNRAQTALGLAPFRPRLLAQAHGNSIGTSQSCRSAVWS